MKAKPRLALDLGLATAFFIFTAAGYAVAQSQRDPSELPGKTGGTSSKPAPAARSPTAKDRAQPGVGSLTVRTKVSGVEVSLNGKLIGKTEAGGVLVVTNLPPGTYRVKASKAGFMDWEREVEVVRNANTEVAITTKAVVSIIGDPFKHVQPPDLQQEPEQRQRARSENQYHSSTDLSIRVNESSTRPGEATSFPLSPQPSSPTQLVPSVGLVAPAPSSPPSPTQLMRFVGNALPAPQGQPVPFPGVVLPPQGQPVPFPGVVLPPQGQPVAVLPATGGPLPPRPTQPVSFVGTIAR